jgi:hypothetical protein
MTDKILTKNLFVPVLKIAIEYIPLKLSLGMGSELVGCALGIHMPLITQNTLERIHGEKPENHNL